MQFDMELGSELPDENRRWIFARERREISSTASSASIKAVAKLSGFEATASARSAATEKVDMRRNESGQWIVRHRCISRNQGTQRATGRGDPGQERAAATDLHKHRAAIDAPHHMVNRLGGRDRARVRQQINRCRDSGLRGAVTRNLNR
jgi:hypothetical protein